MYFKFLKPILYHSIIQIIAEFLTAWNQFNIDSFSAFIVLSDVHHTQKAKSYIITLSIVIKKYYLLLYYKLITCLAVLKNSLVTEALHKSS